MFICIPIEDDNGLQSRVCPHFGSAPTFLIVDGDSGQCRAIPNRNAHHAHGMCAPLQSLNGERFDAIVVGGIGMGALMKLATAGVQVFLSDRATVAEVVDAMKAGVLRRMDPSMACQGHGHGHD